jgi:hypothetical protein
MRKGLKGFFSVWFEYAALSLGVVQR